MQLRDPEIVQVVLTANEGEVAEGNIAVMRASSDAVRDFAQMMVTDHTAAAEQASDLGDTIGIDPTDVAVALNAEANQTIMALNDASDDEFDALYMESQVKAHQEVLTLVRRTLIPQADDDTLQMLLSNMEATVEAHLNEARDVRDAL